MLAPVLIRRDWNPELIYLNGQFVMQGGGQKDNGRPAIVFLAIARSPNTLPSSLCLSGNFFLLFLCPSVVLAKVLPKTFALTPKSCLGHWRNSSLLSRIRHNYINLQTNSWLFA